MTSLFFTHFPEGTPVKDLWKIFASFGHMGEVVLPSKVDRWGRSFGFIRFIGVDKVKVLERKLENVWVGDCKLRVNMARFWREEQHQRLKVSNMALRGDGVVVQ